MIIRHRRDLWKLLQKQFGGVPNDAVEIGVAEGFFSADMLDWPINLSRLYMVDRWRCVADQKGDASNPQAWHDENFRLAVERVKRFGPRACILRGDSVEMADLVRDQILVLVYIDGDHSYEGVTNDILAWRSKVIPGGFIAFHDYQNSNYGVKKAVQDFCKGRLDIHLLPEDKPEDAGAYFQLPC